MTRLKFLRLSLNLTLVELERRAHIKRWRLELAEKERLPLTGEEMERLAKVFGVKSAGMLAPMPIK